MPASEHELSTFFQALTQDEKAHVWHDVPGEFSDGRAWQTCQDYWLRLPDIRGSLMYQQFRKLSKGNNPHVHAFTLTPVPVALDTAVRLRGDIDLCVKSSRSILCDIDANDAEIWFEYATPSLKHNIFDPEYMADGKEPGPMCWNDFAAACTEFFLDSGNGLNQHGFLDNLFTDCFKNERMVRRYLCGKLLAVLDTSRNRYAGSNYHWARFNQCTRGLKSLYGNIDVFKELHKIGIRREVADKVITIDYRYMTLSQLKDNEGCPVSFGDQLRILKDLNEEMKIELQSQGFLGLFVGLCAPRSYSRDRFLDHLEKVKYAREDQQLSSFVPAHDVVGAEDRGLDNKEFEWIYTTLEELGYERRQLLFHCGESCRMDNTNLNVALAHGVRLSHCHTLQIKPEQLQSVKNSDVVVEQCLGSNIALGVGVIAPLLEHSGIPYILGTDNPALICNNLSQELYIWWHLNPKATLERQKQMALLSIDVGYLDEVEKGLAKSWIEKSYQDFYDQASLIEMQHSAMVLMKSKLRSEQLQDMERIARSSEERRARRERRAAISN